MRPRPKGLFLLVFHARLERLPRDSAGCSAGSLCQCHVYPSIAPPRLLLGFSSALKHLQASCRTLEGVFESLKDVTEIDQ